MRIRNLTTLFLLTCLALLSSGRPACGQEEPAELAHARNTFLRETDFAMRPIRDRYLSRLDVLKRTLGARGEARAALAVQDEIDRVRAVASDAAGVAKFAGRWMVTFKVGGTRWRYVISPDGTVILDEENGKPFNRKGKIVQRGTDFILDFNNNTAQRLTLDGARLNVDLFNVMKNPLEGVPDNQGVGIRLGAP